MRFPLTGAMIVAAALAVLVPLPAVAAPPKHIVFLLDRSGSMGQRCSRLGKGEMDRIRRVALNMLRCARDDGGTLVSFYRFGERDRQARIGGADLTPSQARERITELFTDDCTAYGDKHTFIAYSALKVVGDVVGKPGLGPEDAIPDDGGQFAFYIFTDGEEMNAGMDNRPFQRWMDRQKDRNRIVIWKWNVTEPPEDQCPAPDHVTYTVVFGEPTAAARVDPSRSGAGGAVRVQIPKRIRLYARDTVSVDDATDPRLCKGDVPSDARAPASVQESELKVQARVDWGDAGPSGATTEWRIRAPARGVSDSAIDRAALEMEILGDSTGATEVVVPSATLKDGAYPLRLIREQLCSELKRVYPSSDFLLPTEEGDGGLARLGDVRVEHRPTHVYSLQTQEGTPADRPLAELVADRFWVYSTAGRTLRLTGPKGLATDVDYTLTVMREGKPIGDAPDFAMLSGPDGKSGGSVSAPVGGDVALSLPAKAQNPLLGVIGLGFDRPDGTYEVGVCVRPRLARADGHAVAMECQGCDAGSTYHEGDAWCVRVPAVVKDRPFSWIQIAIAVLLLLWALRILYRWKTRPQFPKGLRIGNPHGGEDLRSAHGKGLTGIVALYFRKPLFVELLSEDGVPATYYWRSLPVVKGKPTPKNLLALRPGVAGGRTVWAWCRSVETEDDGPVVELSIDGTPLTPRASVPSPGSSEIVAINTIDVPSTRPVVKLFRKTNRQELCYPITVDE